MSTDDYQVAGLDFAGPSRRELIDSVPPRTALENALFQAVNWIDLGQPAQARAVLLKLIDQPANT